MCLLSRLVSSNVHSSLATYFLVPCSCISHLAVSLLCMYTDQTGMMYLLALTNENVMFWVVQKSAPRPQFNISCDLWVHEQGRNRLRWVLSVTNRIIFSPMWALEGLSNCKGVISGVSHAFKHGIPNWTSRALRGSLELVRSKVRMCKLSKWTGHYFAFEMQLLRSNIRSSLLQLVFLFAAAVSQI